MPVVHTDPAFMVADDGIHYLRVTSLTGQWPKGPQFRAKRDEMGAKAFREMANAKARIGTIVHNHIEKCIKADGQLDTTGIVPQYGKRDGREVLKHLKSFARFWEDHRPTVLHLERRIYSESLRLCGAPDLLCEIDGQRAVLDWKTGAGLYYSAALQARQYSLLAAEVDGEPYPELYLVRTGSQHKCGYELVRVIGSRKWYGRTVTPEQLDTDLVYCRDTWERSRMIAGEQPYKARAYKYDDVISVPVEWKGEA